MYDELRCHEVLDNYIADRILELCEQKNMTQYELSKRSGLTQSSISNLMNRGSMPQINTIDKLCKGFGITLSQFFAKGEYPDLTEEQQKVLDEWESLSYREKETVKTILSSIKQLR